MGWGQKLRGNPRKARQAAEAAAAVAAKRAAIAHAAAMQKIQDDAAIERLILRTKNKKLLESKAKSSRINEFLNSKSPLPKSLTPEIDERLGLPNKEKRMNALGDVDWGQFLEFQRQKQEYPDSWDEEENDENSEYDEYDDYNPSAFKEGGHAVHVAPLKETGIIEGPGKGQDDVIATSVPESSYIIDASSVSDLGDGSSEAGAAVFDAFFEMLRNKNGIKKKIDVSNATEVPVYLSNDEYLIDPSDVTLLGGGDNNRGARILKGIVKNIRKHKSSNGTGLPPKAKDITQYFPKKI